MVPDSAIPAGRNSRREEIVAEQVRLLYMNTEVALVVTVVAATILIGLQWDAVPKSIALGWWVYMVLVSVGRIALTQAYRRASPGPGEIAKWRTAIAVAAGAVGIGWGGAGILLYPEAHLTNQLFLVFVLGGMMLGAASLLAPRPEAYLSFLLPAGLAAAIRFISQGDTPHIAMGMLAAVFTVVTTLTTGRICRTINSSLRLQFENRDLLDDLKAAKDQSDALNRALEVRVEERTAELRSSAEQLRTEIAHRKQIEEELLRARNLESLGVLAGGIAHDFNNLLTVIQGNVELCREYAHPGEPAEKILDEAASACRRAALLSSQLLTFAKGGAPVRRLLSLKALLIEAVQLISAGANVKIELDIAEDLWPAEVDSGQIGQVLHNILLNARQAMPEGGIVRVRAENVVQNTAGAGAWVRVSIRDYGCGIPPDVLPRIFDPYFTTKERGTGLGLATAYAIVTRHGGHISVNSKPGEGATFAIDLPATLKTPAPEAATAMRLQGGKGRILVMDDEEALRRLLSNLLTALGYEVQTARDGTESIAMYESARTAGAGFDAVLLDLTVSGGMGGLEAAARLRELDPSVKLIVSSGYSDSAVMSDFATHGFDAVVPKPWAPSQLSEIFRQVLGDRRSA